MKRKDIENRLRNEAAQFTPDPLDSIKITARSENLLPYDSEGNSEVYSQGNTAVIGRSKRKTIRLFAAFAAVVVCLVLILSFALNFGTNKPLDPTRMNFSVEDVYGMGAVSSVRLLGSTMSANAVRTFSAVSAATQARASGVMSASSADNSEQEVKEQSERFNEYFTAFDSFLGEDILSTSTEKNTDGRYPYKVKMTIKGNDLAGKTISYVMYYTETLVKTDFDDEKEETESEYQLVGVMVIDGVNYHLEGERTEETEKGESETELKIRAYADISDKTSYIQMEQEHSLENDEAETEYVYSIYANGKLLEETAIEFETKNKNKKVETKYELEFRSGASKGKYVVEREVKGDRSAIKVKYDIDDKKGVFHIREIFDGNGKKQYEYTFSDDEVIVF